MFILHYLDRATVSSSLKGAIDMLHGADEDIRQLVSHVGVFSDWWLSMKGNLQSLLAAIPQVPSCERLNRLRTVDVSRRWAHIKEQYQSYSRTVSGNSNAWMQLILLCKPTQINTILLFCPLIQTPEVVPPV
jgi:hypothetical protein